MFLIDKLWSLVWASYPICPFDQGEEQVKEFRATEIGQFTCGKLSGKTCVKHSQNVMKELRK